MSRHHSIAVIPGDGIGPEVVRSAREVLDAAATPYGVTFAYTELDWSCRRFHEHGTMMPADGIEVLRDHDSVLLGAVGWPGVPDHESLWGLLIPIRREFDLAINYRPIRRLAGLRGPFGNEPRIDLVVVRENVEGEYSEVGGRIYRGSPQELAVQTSVFTRRGVERAAEFAFVEAEQRGGSVVSATKSNGLIHSMPFWDEVVESVARRHPSTNFRSEHIDALCAKLVTAPERFQVIVASNLFGDILSDLTAAVAGSLGIAPSANLPGLEGGFAMFEPVHGSAPDIAGTGVANPVGAIWSAALMAEHLGHPGIAGDMVSAIETAVADPRARTLDLGGAADTRQCTEAVLAALGRRDTP